MGAASKSRSRTREVGTGIGILAAPALGWIIGLFWFGLVVDAVWLVSSWLALRALARHYDTGIALAELRAAHADGLTAFNGVCLKWRRILDAQASLVRWELRRASVCLLVTIACLMGTLRVPVTGTVGGSWLIAVMVMITTVGHLAYGQDLDDLRRRANAPNAVGGHLLGFWERVLDAGKLDRVVTSSYLYSGLHAAAALVVASSIAAGAIGIGDRPIGPGAGATAAKDWITGLLGFGESSSGGEGERSTPAGDSAGTSPPPAAPGDGQPGPSTPSTPVPTSTSVPVSSFGEPPGPEAPTTTTLRSSSTTAGSPTTTDAAPAPTSTAIVITNPPSTPTSTVDPCPDLSALEELLADARSEPDAIVEKLRQIMRCHYRAATGGS